MRARTILAFIALIVVSLAVRQVRSMSADGAWTYDSAVVTVDGAAHALSVGVPSAMLSHVSTVTVSLEVAPGHVVTAGSAAGPFATTINVAPAPDGSNLQGSGVRVSAAVSSDVPVEAQVSVSGGGRLSTQGSTGLDASQLQASINH